MEMLSFYIIQGVLVMENNDRFDIIYFAPCKFNQGVGGSARLTNMCRVLNEMGLKIHLISYVNGDKFKIEKEQYNEFLSATTVYVPRNYPRALKFLAIFPMLINGIKKINKTNMIFTQAPSMVTGFPGVILKKLFNKPLVVDHIDVKDAQTPVFLCNYVMKNCTMVFALTNYLMKDAMEKGCDNVFYMPLFLNTEFFNKNLDQRYKLRQKLGISSEDVVIGYAGTLSPVEGVPILLKAFKNLYCKFKNIKLVVIGVPNVNGSDNVYKLSQELGLGEEVIILPPQPFEQMPNYLSMFDIACSPKKDLPVNRATVPIKIYEYMSMGLTTVISAVGETVNMASDKKDVFLFKPDDPEDLEEILTHIIKKPDIALNVGERARKKMVDNFSEPALKGRIKLALSELM